MRNSQKYEEPMLTVQIRSNEIIAINLAISYFLRLCKLISPVYPEASQLLGQFQRRLTAQLPASEGLPQQSELRH